MQFYVKIFVHKPEDDKYYLRLVRDYTREIEDSIRMTDEVLEDAFAIFNAPIDSLTREQIQILGDYHRYYPSLSVGDYVVLATAEFPDKIQVYKCASFGWDRVEMPAWDVPLCREFYLKRRYGPVNLEVSHAR